MTDIFISYARQDHRVAKQLNQEFHSRGWDVWWDQGLLAGQTFEEEIQRALDTAGCVIVLWSKHAIVSDWVKDEADEGRRRGILVPAKIAEVAIPLGFRRIHCESLIGWQGEKAHSGFVRLSRAVEGVLKRRGRAPAPKTPLPSPGKRASAISEPLSSSPRRQQQSFGHGQPLDPTQTEKSPVDRDRKSDDVAISWGPKTTSKPAKRALVIESLPKNRKVEVIDTEVISSAGAAAVDSGSTKGTDSSDQSPGSAAANGGTSDLAAAVLSGAIESRLHGRSQASVKRAPAVDRSSRYRFSWRRWLGRTIGLIAFLIFGLWAILKVVDPEHSRVDQGQSETSSKAAAATGVEPNTSSREAADSQRRELAILRVEEEQLAAKVSVLRDLHQARWAAVLILTGISEALPESVWLQHLTLEGSEVKFGGKALNTSAIADFLESLQMKPGFREPKVHGMSRDRTEYKFSIDFDLDRDALKAAPRPAVVSLSEELMSSDPAEAKNQLAENLLNLKTEHGRLLAGLAGDQLEVLRRLRLMFEVADASLLSFKPRPTDRAGPFPKTEIEAKVRTSYHDLIQLLDRISGFSRLTVVDFLRISGRSGQNPSTSATLRLSVYSLPEDQSPSELPTDPSELADGSRGIELPAATTRDPYRSLVESEGTREERPDGIGGLLVVELKILGLFMLEEGTVAQVQSAGGTSYLLRKGDDLFDGRVLEVTMNEVVFEQRVEPEAGSGQTVRRVVKTIAP